MAHHSNELTSRRAQPDTRFLSIDFSDSNHYAPIVAAPSVSGERPQTFCVKMNAHGSIVDHYLGEFRSGRYDDAFHSLIEADSAIISDLINAYEDTKDTDTKVFLIEVVSEFRLDSSLYFLRHALRRDEPQIWKAALNGMAMAESSEALDAMDHVLSSVQDSTKREWIEEAITDTNAKITRKQNKRMESNG